MATEQNIIDIVSKQRDYFNSSATHSYEFRHRALQKLKQGILKYEEQFIDALRTDLGKSRFEAYVTEIGYVLNELSDTLRHLKKWMKPERKKTSILSQPAMSQVISTPLGVNLIISPFNYPMQLAIAPLIAAIAAGNTVVLKASELTPATGEVLQKLITELFEPEYIAFIPGEVPETTILLQQKFDHIFFTGSPVIGSIVMAAAAKHLTPVTLELGGKSPCIVHSDADINLSVKRIVSGKFINAGQTCIAPDYVLVHKSVEKDFLEKLKNRIKKCYGHTPSKSPDYGRIVNKRHHKRIVDMIDPEKVFLGGESVEQDRFIAPTIMNNVTLDDKVMSEEIFGPVLPVLTYENFQQIFEIIGQLPKHPLACYIFSSSKAVQDELTSKIQFGGGCINHCLMHVANSHLPFGGVGESGIGSYHGHYGFECFSHKKSMLKAATWIDLPLVYPPYKNKLKYLRMLLK